MSRYKSTKALLNAVKLNYMSKTRLKSKSSATDLLSVKSTMIPTSSRVPRYKDAEFIFFSKGIRVKNLDPCSHVELKQI